MVEIQSAYCDIGDDRTHHRWIKEFSDSTFEGFPPKTSRRYVSVSLHQHLLLLQKAVMKGIFSKEMPDYGFQTYRSRNVEYDRLCLLRHHQCAGYDAA